MIEFLLWGKDNFDHGLKYFLMVMNSIIMDQGSGNQNEAFLSVLMIMREHDSENPLCL